MPTTIDTTSNPLAAYGYDANTGQQLATQLGMTPAQLAAAFAATPTSPGGGRDIQATINQLQVMKASGMGAAPAAAGQPGSTPVSVNGSYYGSGAQSGSGNMNWNDLQNYGYSASDIATFQQHGWSPSQVWDSVQKGTASAPTAATNTAGPQNAFGIKQVGTGQGYTILQNNKGQNLAVDNAGNYFNIDTQGNHSPVTDSQAQAMGFQSANPETNALKQQAAIDPTSEGLRSQLAASYATPLSQGTTPSAADYKSYLTQFQQLDPEEYAQRQGLATSMDSYLQQAQAQNALGSQLDPVTARQVEQSTRAAQAARGNVYGTPQMAEEAMTTGQAGLALQQQRMQNLGTALGAQQGYLGSGLGLGDTALSLYQQNRSNLQNAQNSALSYLGSGQTPYQTGASYLNQANQNAGTAAQGGPVYQPAALGSTTQASQIPQYGLDIGQQSQNWYNSLQAYSGQTGAATKNPAVSAATGALSGAASGAVGGSAFGPYGTAIGAGVGALAGGASGYFS